MSTATARIESPPYTGNRTGARITDGPHVGAIFWIRGNVPPIGTIVRVRFHPDDQFCTVEGRTA